MINWIYNNEEVTQIDDFPDNTYGFVYVITHLPTGKKYIGKKILYFTRKVKLGKKDLRAFEGVVGRRPSYKLEIVRDMNKDGKINKLDTVKIPLKQNGDFRSHECIEILKESDIVVTNPPFSLFREYVTQLIDYNKSFIIIGFNQIITCWD